MRTEVSIRIKNEDGSTCVNHKESELIEDLHLTETDEKTQRLVNDALAKFQGTPHEIAIKTITFV